MIIGFCIVLRPGRTEVPKFQSHKVGGMQEELSKKLTRSGAYPYVGAA